MSLTRLICALVMSFLRYQKQQVEVVADENGNNDHYSAAAVWMFLTVFLHFFILSFWLLCSVYIA